MMRYLYNGITTRYFIYYKLFDSQEHFHRLTGSIFCMFSYVNFKIINDGKKNFRVKTSLIRKIVGSYNRPIEYHFSFTCFFANIIYEKVSDSDRSYQLVSINQSQFNLYIMYIKKYMPTCTSQFQSPLLIDNLHKSIHRLLITTISSKYVKSIIQVSTGPPEHILIVNHYDQQ